MNNLHLISVLMPARNAEEYISEAIESILDQTYENFELIIADDASTDLTWQKMKNYKAADKRIRIFQNKTHLGIAGTRNSLIKRSKGSYIVWQDTDDISVPGRLQDQYSFLKKHPDVGIVGGYLHFFDDAGNQSIRKYKPDDKNIRSRIFRYSPVAQPAAMIRRVCFEACGYLNPVYKVASDLDMSFRIGMKYRFANLQKTEIYYRYHSSSITSCNIRENELTTLSIRNHYQNSRLYKMSIFDKIYNILQYFSVFIIPRSIKRKLFILLRNYPVKKVYFPQTHFHLIKNFKEKSKKPVISVLMPAYNAEKYIGEAIESILAQTFENFEFIIINDASTDNTLGIIQKYAKKDKRIIVKQNKKNLYIAENRNVLIKLAKRKYIAWQDADDISLPDRLQKQYEFMEQNQKVGIVGGYLEFFDEKGTESIRKYTENDKDLRKTIFRFSPVAQPTAMIRRECFDKVGIYNSKYPPAEDIDLSFRIGIKYQFANIPQITLKYREHNESATFQELRKIELTTLHIRNLYQGTKQYKMNVADKMYNLLQYLSIYFVPTYLKVKLFNLLRNEKFKEVYIPKTYFHLEKKNFFNNFKNKSL